MNSRGGPPITAADALARARAKHGAPADDPKPNSPEDVGFVSTERKSAGPSHEPRYCKSCSAAILWAQVLDANRRDVVLKPDGRPRAMPIDWTPSPQGTVVCLDRGGTIVAYTLRKGETPPLGARLRTAHHMTCPEGQKWKKGRGRGGRR